ncbi:MAG TPA: D-glycerate dehydrogenase [Thermomicrobiales bacterium]|nr:D-glycerate dehydrogenase [Thermomicrobiales bacterium]
MTSKPLVAVTRPIPEAGIDLLRGHCEIRQWEDELPPSPEELDSLLNGVDGALTLLTDRIDGPLLDRHPTLRVVSNFAVGYDNVDVDAATKHGVAVCNTPGVLTETTAEMSFALLMATARRIPEGVDYVRDGKWKTWGPLLLLGQDVYGATLGIVGFGRIGREVARMATGFSMKILAWDRSPETKDTEGLDVQFVELDDLLKEADFVSLHVALAPETHHLIDARELGLMKKTAILINAARGPVVDTDALVQSLREGDIFAAGLDVTDPEPLPADHPLVSMPNCTVVPHIASATVSSRDNMATLAARNLFAVLKGERPEYIINPDVLKKDK